MEKGIYFQIIGLFLSLIIAVIFFNQKKAELLKERILSFSIIICLLLQLFSLATRLIIQFLPLETSTFLLIISFKASLALMVVEVLVTSLFLIFDSINKENQYKTIYLVVALSIVFAGVVAILGLDVITQDEVVVLSGLAYDVSYYICWFIALLLVVAIILNRKKLNLLYILASIFWIVTWNVGVVINKIFGNDTCLSLPFAIALIIVVCLSENLENSFSKELEIFQYDALMTFLKLRYLSNKQLSMLYIYIFNDNNEYRKELIINDMMNESINLFRRKSSFKIFKTKSNELVLCSADTGQIDDAMAKLKEYYDKFQLEQNFANRVSASIVYVEDLHYADSPIDLMNLLYSTKNQSSKDPLNTEIIRIDASLAKQIKAEMQMVREIDDAIENDRVELNYQPVFDVKKNYIVSVEVLTRLKSSEGKTILPNEFIPIAEKYNRIVQLGEKILKKSCDFFKEMSEKGIVLDDISINFSSYQIENKEIINSIIDAVGENDINPGSLCIEITNAHSVRKKKEYLQSINKLASFGVKISLTGFGSDESNLDYIINTPADLIRLDRFFVWQTIADEKSKILLNSIVNMVHSFNMKLVAVGVETKEQYEELLNMDIDYLQGIYISRPLSKNEFESFANAKGGKE